MLKSMCWTQYCRWYLHYLREPWGAKPLNYYLSHLVFATLAAVVKKVPKIEECVYSTMPKKQNEEMISDDELKAKLSQMIRG